MLPLSPSLFSTPFGWTLDDHITKVSDEPNSNRSLFHFPSFDQIQQDFAPEDSSSFGGAVNGVMRVAKKLSHNATERDRRKRLNDFYESLRSLVPMPSDRKKKTMSIPGIISRAVMYIPELEKEVETLIHKKEKLWSNSSSKANTKGRHGMKKQSGKDAIIKEKSSFVSSVRVLGEKEAVIQLISSTNNSVCKNKDIVVLSEVLESLEQEEDEFILIDATTIKCNGEGMLVNTLHFQVQGNHKIEAETLKEKLRYFNQQ